MNRALATLARLRRLEADQARRELGEAVCQETEAEHTAARTRAQRAQEAEAARAHLGDGPANPLASTYSNWLTGSIRMIAAADLDVTTRRAGRADAAAGLVARRAALEAVETLIGIADTASRRQAARLAQHRLDELSCQPANAAQAGQLSDVAAGHPTR